MREEAAGQSVESLFNGCLSSGSVKGSTQDAEMGSSKPPRVSEEQNNESQKQKVSLHLFLLSSCVCVRMRPPLSSSGHSEVSSFMWKLCIHTRCDTRSLQTASVAQSSPPSRDPHLHTGCWVSCSRGEALPWYSPPESLMLNEMWMEIF